MSSILANYSKFSPGNSTLQAMLSHSVVASHSIQQTVRNMNPFHHAPSNKLARFECMLMQVGKNVVDNHY